MGELKTYEVHCSEVTSDEKRIGCETWFYVVDAESEEEAKKLILEDEPDTTIDRVVLRSENAA